MWGANIVMVAAGMVLAAPLGAQSIDPVHVYDRANFTSGNGVRFLVQNGCATVTAGHVVADTNYPEITPARASLDTANVVILANRLDVAIIRQNHADPRQCGVLPTEAEVEAALRSGGNREVRLVDSGGAVTAIAVDLVGYDNFDITLRLEQGQEITSFQPGNSGSLVVFGGVPVGIITDGFTGFETAQGKAIRLDYVLRSFPDQLARPVATPPQFVATRPLPPRRPPYDITQLPSDFQRVVQDARLNRRRAEQAEEQAARVERAVEEVVQRTRFLPESKVEDGIAWYRTNDGNGIYRGEVSSGPAPSSLISEGYGLREMTGQNATGNQMLCVWGVDDGCSGFATLRYGYNSDNSNNLDVYRGAVVSNRRQGFGYLRWKIEPDLEYSGFYPAEMWGIFEDLEKSSPEVWESTDGRRYEGYAAGILNGMGVIWDEHGQVQYLGRWDDGEFVENVTQAWRDGAYVAGSIESEGE